jgi:aminobenzoyl-glutamate utilization protein B
MAATAAAVLTDPDLLAAAKADLADRVGDSGYVSPLPAHVEPPLTMSS